MVKDQVGVTNACYMQLQFWKQATMNQDFLGLLIWRFRGTFKGWFTSRTLSLEEYNKTLIPPGPDSVVNMETASDKTIHIYHTYNFKADNSCLIVMPPCSVACLNYLLSITFQIRPLSLDNLGQTEVPLYHTGMMNSIISVTQFGEYLRNGILQKYLSYTYNSLTIPYISRVFLQYIVGNDDKTRLLHTILSKPPTFLRQCHLRIEDKKVRSFIGALEMTSDVVSPKYSVSKNVTLYFSVINCISQNIKLAQRTVLYILGITFDHLSLKRFGEITQDFVYRITDSHQYDIKLSFQYTDTHITYTYVQSTEVQDVLNFDGVHLKHIKFDIKRSDKISVRPKNLIRIKYYILEEARYEGLVLYDHSKNCMTAESNQSSS